MIPPCQHSELSRISHQAPLIIGLRNQRHPQPEFAVSEATHLSVLERFRFERPNPWHNRPTTFSPGEQKILGASEPDLGRR